MTLDQNRPLQYRVKITLLMWSVLFTCSIFANTIDDYHKAFTQKDFPAAFSILEALKELDPQNADLYYQSAKTCMGLKDYAGAENNAAQAVIKAPEVSEHHRLFADTQVLKFVSTQNTSIIKLPGLARRVKRSYQTAVNLDPDNIKAREGLGLYYLMAPKLIGGSIKRAQQQAAAIEKLNPKSAYRLKIGILQKRKKHQKALALIDEWETKYPGNWRAAESRFYHHMEQKDYPAAAKLLTEWLAKDPSEMNANYLLGLVAAISGNYLDQGEQALLAYNAYTPDMEQPGHEWSYYRLANIYEHKGDMEKAIKAAKKAEALQPANKKVVKQVQELLSKNE